MTLLDDALAAIPGYSRAATAVATAKSWRAPVNITAGTERRRLGEELMAAATAGRALPDGLAERLTADETAGKHQSEVAVMIRETLEHAQANLKTVTLDGIGTAYDHLRTQLGALCEQVRDEHDTLTPLIGLNADAAIRTKQINQWQHAEELADRYAAIRHAHFSLCAIEDGTTNRHVFAVSGQLKDPCDVDPYWITRRAYSFGRIQPAITDATYQRHIAWLRDAHNRPTESHHRSDVYPTTMPRLAWLITVDQHDPWVPDHRTLIDAYDTAHTATGPDVTAAQARTRMTTPTKETTHA